jgi:hypothetical protein
MSEVKVNKISPRSGTTVTLGDSGDTIAVASGASLSGFTSTGIDDNATSTAVTILSSGYVGIGQTNPTTNFHVGDDSTGSENTSIRIEGGSTSGYSQLHFADGNDVNVGKVQYTHSTNNMDFYTNDAERMRIDSTGNVLVGTTSAANISNGTNAGIGLIAQNDYLAIARDGGSTAFFNRLTSDGDIVVFRKDGATIGSIGTRFGYTRIGVSNTNLIFDGGNDRIAPSDSNLNAQDNTTTLGWSDRRFKDLYLGGNIYLGGTGSANALDDYEEGTWTPIYSSSGGDPSSVTYDKQDGYYQKIGNFVYAWFSIRTDAINTSGMSGDLYVRNLPFTSDGNLSFQLFPGGNIWADAFVDDSLMLHVAVLDGTPNIVFAPDSSFSGTNFDNLNTGTDDNHAKAFVAYPTDGF